MPVAPRPPLTVELHRGPEVESRHVVHAVVVDPTGEVVVAWGDPERPTHPRSAVKSVQALPLVETGAADAFAVTPAELALACASHTGEPGHVAAVEAWLARIGCTHADLECGVQEGRGATAAGNNCSGKHAGFLTVARHLGVPTAGYVRPDHPVQRLVRDACAELTGATIDPARAGTDGCGIPVHPVPLRSIALAGARLAAPGGTVPATRRAALERLAAATVAHPWEVEGTGRLTTELLAAGRGDVLVKPGAEGVALCGLPTAGLGIAVKAEDGAGRAASTALGHVLAALAAGDGDRPGAALPDGGWRSVFAPRAVLANHAGTVVGRLVVAEGPAATPTP